MRNCVIYGVVDDNGVKFIRVGQLNLCSLQTLLLLLWCFRAATDQTVDS